MSTSPLAILAYDGNALLRADPLVTPRELDRAAVRAAKAVGLLARDGFRVIVVPGAGADLDEALVRAEEAATKLPPTPALTSLAAAQGVVGARLSRAISHELRRLGRPRGAVAVATHVLVSPDDDALTAPSVPVGPWVNGYRAKRLQTEGVSFVEDSARGWRRVLAAPRPIEVLDLEAIEALLDSDHVVITGLGGGLPVSVDSRGQRVAMDAVLNESRVAGLLGEHLGAELLVTLTPHDHVIVHPGRLEQRVLERVSAAELKALHAETPFAAHGLADPVEAAITFIEDGGDQALITSARQLAAGLADRGGTRVSLTVEPGPARRQIPLFPADPPPPEEDLS